MKNKKIKEFFEKNNIPLVEVVMVLAKANNAYSSYIYNTNQEDKIEKFVESKERWEDAIYCLQKSLEITERIQKIIEEANEED